MTEPSQNGTSPEGDTAVTMGPAVRRRYRLTRLLTRALWSDQPGHPKRAIELKLDRYGKQETQQARFTIAISTISLQHRSYNFALSK